MFPSWFPVKSNRIVIIIDKDKSAFVIDEVRGSKILKIDI